MNRKPALIAGLVGLGLVLVMVVGLILPKASQIRAKQTEVDQATQQEGVLRTQLQQLQAAAKDAPKDRKRLNKLEAQIPSSADLPSLIRLLNGTAEDSGVDFMTVAPGQPVATGAISTIPVQITVTGGFFAVDQYLYLLEKLPRVSTVANLNTAAGPNGLPQLQVVLMANFFTTDTSAGPGSVPGGAPEDSAAAPAAPTSGG